MTFDLLNLILVLIVTIGAIVIGYLLCQIVGMSNSICGICAVGGKINLTRDNTTHKFVNPQT